jgi:large subunit ribosomal protein L13
MKTKFANLESVSKTWHIVDASDLILGRMASRIASILRGKHKPMYSPHVDTGDFVVVINANKIKVSGEKENKKIYWRHSGFVGGGTATSFEEQRDRFPTRVIELAVKGMLPKTRLGRKMFKKLKVYADASHPHVAQNPVHLSI